MVRPKVPKDIEAEILVKSARRCALCYHLVGDLTEKRGQIAHLDHNRLNNKEDNLAFMCFEHHDLYDTTTSQSKNYTQAEAKRARDNLHAAIAAREHFKGDKLPRSTRHRKPRLHVVYDFNQCIWGIGGQLQRDGSLKKVMSIHFWAVITNDSDESIAILEACPEGAEPQLGSFQQVILPHRPVRQMISAFALPILGTVGEPLRTRFVLKDQYGRRYYTPQTNFRWVSSGIEKLPDK